MILPLTVSAAVGQASEVLDAPQFTREYADYRVFEQRSATSEYSEYRLEPRVTGSAEPKVERIYGDAANAQAAVRTFSFLKSALESNSELQLLKVSQSAPNILRLGSPPTVSVAEVLRYGSGIDPVIQRRLLARYTSALHTLQQTLAPQLDGDGSVWVDEAGPYLDIPVLHLMVKSKTHFMTITIKPENVAVDLKTLRLTIRDYK